MKKQLMLFVLIFCAGLQSNLSLCAEMPKPILVRMREWMASYFSPTKTEDKHEIKGPSGKTYLGRKAWLASPEFEEYQIKRTTSSRLLEAATMSVSATAFSALLFGSGLTIADRLSGRSYPSVEQIKDMAAGAPSISLFAFALLGICEIIGDAANYDTRSEIIAKIKEVIRAYINNALLYPTRSSKIHALLKKEDFLEYVGLYAQNVNTVLDYACASLSEEINNLPYIKVQDNDTETDKEIKIKNVLDEESKIDAELSFLRNHFKSSNDSIESQIKALETMINKGGSIAQIRAYLSFYYRLLNKQKIEELLTPEQKAARKGGWDYTIAEGLAPEKIAERQEVIKREQGIEQQKAIEKQKTIKKLGSPEAYEAMRTRKLNEYIRIKSAADNANDRQGNE